jgi:outer membrane lipoprotein SlyB
MKQEFESTTAGEAASGAEAETEPTPEEVEVHSAVDAETGDAAGVAGVIGAAIGAVSGGPIGAALGAASGMVVGAAAEIAMHPLFHRGGHTQHRWDDTGQVCVDCGASRGEKEETERPA